MNCKNCGSPLGPGDVFCKNCGAPVENAQQMNNNQMNNEPAMNNNQGFNNPGPMMYNNGPVVPNNQMYNPGPMMYPYQKKNNNTVIAIIGGLVVIAIVVLIVVLLTGKGNNTSGGGTANNGGGTTNNGGGTTIANNNTYSVSFNGYKFSVPTHYVAKESNGILHIYDDGTWVVGIMVDSSITYSQLKAAQLQLKASLQNSGYTVKNSGVKTLDGMECVTFEISYGGQNEILAYGQLNSNTVFGLEMASPNNDFDYSLANKVSSIIKSAKVESATSSIKSGINVDLKGVLDNIK